MNNKSSKLILTLLFLMGFTYVGYSQNQEDPRQRDWAKFNRYAEANEQVTTTPKVVFMGNSITDNWARMRPDFFSNNNFIGRGISGQTSSEMLVRFRQDVINLHPKVVVILAGTNDVATNNGFIELKNVVGNIQSMCQLAKANNITPIVCSVLPCAGFRWRQELKPAPTIIELNKLIKELCDDSGILYVDYHTPMANSEGGLPENLSRDGCHPVDEGYVIMEKIILENIQKVLK